MTRKRKMNEQMNGDDTPVDVGQSDAFIVWPFTIAEFEFIQKNFNTNNVDVMDKIVELLKMWQFRANDERERIVLIDLTKMVFQGLAFYYRYVLGNDVIKDPKESSQHIFCNVISRFVNYLSELYKRVSNVRHISMHNATMQYGVPGYIVNMRHSIVHDTMPCLEDLCGVARYCRDWLFDTCWKQQIEIAFLPLDVPIAKPRIKHSEISNIKIQKLLDEFCTTNMQPNNTKKLPQIILDIRSLILEDSKTVSVVIGESFIIKSRQQLDDMNLQYDNELKWKLPNSWKTFWKEIVFALQECAALGTCMVHLSSQVLASDELFFKAQYAAWVAHLIDRLNLTTFSIAYPHLCALADNMLKSKVFYDRDKFLYIINQMGSNLPVDRKHQYIKSFDSDEEITIGLNEKAVVAKENENVHFGLITPNKPLGLIHDQLKTTLNLDIDCFISQLKR